MSDIFAKLYERDGKQVLVTKETDDSDCPAVAFRTTTANGHSVTIMASMGNKTKDWDKRDKAFDNVTEESAWSMVDSAPGIDL